MSNKYHKKAKEIENSISKKQIDEILEMENVLRWSIGFAKRDGKTTREPSLIIWVSEKKSEIELEESNKVPSTINGYPTDVRVEREAVPELQTDTDEGLLRDKLRDVIAGSQVEASSLCSTGLTGFEDEDGDTVALTNTHCLGDDINSPNGGFEGDPVYQPSASDQIGTVKIHGDIENNSNSSEDIAFIKEDGSASYTTEVFGYGNIEDFVEPELGEWYVNIGRTHGVSFGQCIDLGGTDSSIGIARANPVDFGGHSGSAWYKVDGDTVHPIGIHWGGFITNDEYAQALLVDEASIESFKNISPPSSNSSSFDKSAHSERPPSFQSTIKDLRRTENGNIKAKMVGINAGGVNGSADPSKYAKVQIETDNSNFTNPLDETSFIAGTSENQDFELTFDSQIVNDGSRLIIRTYDRRTGNETHSYPYRFDHGDFMGVRNYYMKAIGNGSDIDSQSAGDIITVDYTVENTLSEEGTDTAELVVNGEVVDSEQFTLAGGSSYVSTLQWNSSTGDDLSSANLHVRTSDDIDTAESGPSVFPNAGKIEGGSTPQTLVDQVRYYNSRTQIYNGFYDEIDLRRDYPVSYDNAIDINLNTDLDITTGLGLVQSEEILPSIVRGFSVQPTSDSVDFESFASTINADKSVTLNSNQAFAEAGGITPSVISRFTVTKEPLLTGSQVSTLASTIQSTVAVTKSSALSLVESDAVNPNITAALSVTKTPNIQRSDLTEISPSVISNFAISKSPTQIDVQTEEPTPIIASDFTITKQPSVAEIQSDGIASTISANISVTKNATTSEVQTEELVSTIYLGTSVSKTSPLSSVQSEAQTSSVFSDVSITVNPTYDGVDIVERSTAITSNISVTISTSSDTIYTEELQSTIDPNFAISKQPTTSGIQYDGSVPSIVVGDSIVVTSTLDTISTPAFSSTISSDVSISLAPTALDVNQEEILATVSTAQSVSLSHTSAEIQTVENSVFIASDISIGISHNLHENHISTFSTSVGTTQSVTLSSNIEALETDALASNINADRKIDVLPNVIDVEFDVSSYPATVIIGDSILISSTVESVESDGSGATIVPRKTSISTASLLSNRVETVNSVVVSGVSASVLSSVDIIQSDSFTPSIASDYAISVPSSLLVAETETVGPVIDVDYAISISSSLSEVLSDTETVTISGAKSDVISVGIQNVTSESITTSISADISATLSPVVQEPEVFAQDSVIVPIRNITISPDVDDIASVILVPDVFSNIVSINNKTPRSLEWYESNPREIEWHEDNKDVIVWYEENKEVLKA